MLPVLKQYRPPLANYCLEVGGCVSAFLACFRCLLPSLLAHPLLAPPLLPQLPVLPPLPQLPMLPPLLPQLPMLPVLKQYRPPLANYCLEVGVACLFCLLPVPVETPACWRCPPLANYCLELGGCRPCLLQMPAADACWRCLLTSLLAHLLLAPMPPVPPMLPLLI